VFFAGLLLLLVTRLYVGWEDGRATEGPRHVLEVGVMLPIGAVLCILAGAATAAVGLLLLVPTARFAAAATAFVEGTVVGHDSADTPEATWYYPRVKFAAAGREWVVRGGIGHLRPRPRIGSRVRVFFPPDDPQAAGLGRTGGLWAALGLLAVGIALAAGGVWELVRP
jgi:hypothetical protein